MKRAILALAAIPLLPLAVTGCSDLTDDSVSGQDNFALGDAIPGTNATNFAAAKANFGLTETQQDGLGPIFNERSCSACHSNGAIGGAGQNIERRYGTLTNGVFNGLPATGGSLRSCSASAASTRARASTATRAPTRILRRARPSSQAA